MIKYADDAAVWIQQSVEARRSAGAAVVVLTDTNTRHLCLPVFQNLIAAQAHSLHYITIPAGEPNKNLEQLSSIWQGLTLAGAGRDALLICLGGGMVTDIGGFAASTYKRGIDVVHIPTTLLAMVDAAIGGKTGIDFQHYKNHVGTFYPPEKVLIFNNFLNTLPDRQIKAGFAEVVKYALISGQPLPVFPQSSQSEQWLDIIRASANSKTEIVEKDPIEIGLRKTLNFGHTVGHALESYALAQGLDLLHGEAVAAGMLSEIWLSLQFTQPTSIILTNYIAAYSQLFDKLPFGPESIDDLVSRMRHDKKNSGSQYMFVLLGSDGKAVWDVPVDEPRVRQSLEFMFASNTLTV